MQIVFEFLNIYWVWKYHVCFDTFLARNSRQHRKCWLINMRLVDNHILWRKSVFFLGDRLSCEHRFIDVYNSVTIPFCFIDLTNHFLFLSNNLCLRLIFNDLDPFDSFSFDPVTWINFRQECSIDSHTRKLFLNMEASILQAQTSLHFQCFCVDYPAYLMLFEESYAESLSSMIWLIRNNSFLWFTKLLY